MKASVPESIAIARSQQEFEQLFKEFSLAGKQIPIVAPWGKAVMPLPKELAERFQKLSEGR